MTTDPVEARGQVYLIRAGWALVETPGGQELLRDCTIVVQDGMVVDVVKTIQDRTAHLDRQGILLDWSDCLVLPGFISLHTHTATSSPCRGLIEGGRMIDRPSLLVEETLSDADLDALTAYNLAEMVLSGCTTVVEMSATIRQAESFVRVAETFGVRAYVSVIVPSGRRQWDVWYREDDQVLFDSVEATLGEIEASRSFALSIDGSAGGLIHGQIAAHAPDTHTPETLLATQEAGRDVGNGIHIHLAQRLREADAVRRLWGMRPIEWLESLDFYNQPVIAAHLYKMQPDLDLPILKHHKVAYAHCPVMASLLHQSSQPYPEAIAAGLDVGLGLDKISNDYVENIKAATIIGQQRVAQMGESSPVPLKSPRIEDSVYAATRGGAEALRRDDLGRIAVGSRADLAAIDVCRPPVGVGQLPPEPLHHLLYANGLATKHVMTNGVLQVQGGVLQVADQRDVIAEGGSVTATLWRSLDDEGWFDRPPTANSRR